VRALTSIVSPEPVNIEQGQPGPRPAQMPHDPDAKAAFVTELGRALHEAGTSAQRLEATLEAVSEHLGLIGQFFVTPTSIWAGYGPLHAPRVVLARVEPGDVNLTRLAEINDVADRVATGEVTVHEGREQIEAIRSARSAHDGWPQVAGFVAASSTACVFLGGHNAEIAAAAAIGLIVGLFATISSIYRRVGRLMEFLAGFCAAFIAIALSDPLGGLSTSTVILAGLIVFLPGLTLTLSISELATRHLVSGTARLTHALMIFVSIGFGIALGTRVADAVFTTIDRAPSANPDWLLYTALAIAPVAFIVLFRARWRDLPAIAIAGWIGFAGARYGAHAFGPEIGSCVGAFLLGGFSNGIARLTNRPASITSIPGLMLLVPGSLGMRSLNALMHDDVTSGVDTAFTVVLVAVSLVVGLLLANIALPPRRNL